MMPHIIMDQKEGDSILITGWNISISESLKKRKKKRKKFLNAIL